MPRLFPPTGLLRTFMRELLNVYNIRKVLIKKRLKDFRAVWNKPERKIFSELCFCLCTPQSKAIMCNKAISSLEETGILFKGSFAQISPFLKTNGVRFYNNKTRYIVEARNLFSKNKYIYIKEKINTSDIKKTRDWLVKNIKGLGYKEASHFLRNIGWGKNLAILDVHILRNMLKLKIIKKIPKTISKKQYLQLEKKLEFFSKKSRIPMGELDLLFWSMETREVFK